MKKIKTKAEQHRSVRRFIKQLFLSVIKRQNRNHKVENAQIIKTLCDIQDSIEIIARQIARWIESGK